LKAGVPQTAADLRNAKAGSLGPERRSAPRIDLSKKLIAGSIIIVYVSLLV
jgi:hypothetical protein